jgi:diguanylate cyclase
MTKKYSTANDDAQGMRDLLKQREKSLQRVRAVLGLAVEHLASAADGQDENLSDRIASLRQQMRKGVPSPMVVAQLGTASQALAAVRRNRAEKQLHGFSECIAQLLTLDPPKAMRRELGVFIAHARKVIARPEQQQLLPSQLAAVQAKVFAEVVDAGLRVDSDTAVETLNVETLSADDSLKDLPAYSSVAETIENVLTDMVTSIRAPQQAEAALDKAKQILAAGLNWYELAALLEQLAIVVHAALDNDQREFEAFLQALDVHLSTVNSSFDSLDNVGHSLISTGASLDCELREGMANLADTLDDARSVESLQSSVQQHLDGVLGQLNSNKQQREQLQTQYEEEVGALKSQITQLEKEAEQASQEIQEQQRRSESDQLTGLPNRVAYERKLEIELERWTRYQHKFCLVVADIDHFKLINDRYGHLAGDKVLKVVASTIRKRLRRVDYIARFGGEEFVILLPATDAEQARKLIEDLGQKIRECPFHYNKEPLEITLSFGISQVVEDDTPETLFARADEALYEAKRSGRDRTVVSTQAA